MIPFDHVYFLIVAFGFPIYAAVSFKKFMAELPEDGTVDRVSEYRHTMIVQWLLAVILGALWYGSGRGLGPLIYKGLSPDIGVYLGVGMLVIVTGLLVFSLIHTRSAGEDKLETMRQSLGDEAHFLPRNRGEYHVFVALSFTAGIVEEFIWRGFLLWYLNSFMPLWLAVLVSSLSFGMGHYYQGPTGILKVTGMGLFFSLSYLLSGVLWFAVVLHVLVDILQGANLLHLFREDGERAKSRAHTPA